VKLGSRFLLNPILKINSRTILKLGIADCFMVDRDPASRRSPEKQPMIDREQDSFHGQLTKVSMWLVMSG